MADARKLSKNELIQYMSLVCQMEQNKYLQEKAIEQVESQISRFSNPYNPSKPVEPGKQHKTGGGVFFTILGLFLAYVGITYFVGGAAFYGIFLVEVV